MGFWSERPKCTSHAVDDLNRARVLQVQLDGMLASVEARLRGERICLDKNDPKTLRDEMTMDNSLTQPWSVLKTYHSSKDVVRVDFSCAEGNRYVAIENETYILAGDGKLMPIRRDQPPPDLQYFNSARK